MEKTRMCCVCRERKPATVLIRIAREKIPGGMRFFVDSTGKADGRGCYLCGGCTDKAIKTKALNRSFKGNVGEDIYNKLKEMTE